MTLGTRITRLEAMTRERQDPACRWCSTYWTYPDDFPPVNGVRPPVPACEAPERCPGGGLLVVISNGEDAEGHFVAAASAYRPA